jgi:Protein of unknown function (DUF1153)
MKHVIGPDGNLLTIADLPAPETKRWVIRRKSVVVAALRGGLLTLEEACTRYAILGLMQQGSEHHLETVITAARPIQRIAG